MYTTVNYINKLLLFCRHVKIALNVLTHRGVSEQEGVTVVDKSSGRVMVGGAAPKRNELLDWLQSHRSYQVHLPSRKPSSTSRERIVDGEEV